MFKFAVIDDNKEDRNCLIKEIHEYANYHNIQVYIDEYENAESYDFSKIYDSIFLDIDMPGKQGTTLAREIHKIINTKIIFVTSFDQYLYSTLDAGAFHFIHKSNLRNETIHVLNILFQVLNEHIMIVKTKRGQKNVMIKDILYFVTEDKLTYVFLDNEKYELWESSSSIYEKYKKYNFERVNSSSIINLDYVKDFNDKTVTLKNSKSFSLSYRLKKTFFERYDNYLLGNNVYEYI